MNQATDHELMVTVAGGGLAAMNELYRRRHRSLFRYFFRLTSRQETAEDLVHEVFLRMLRFRHTYHAGNGFEAWMYRIARNVFIDQSKKCRLESPAEENVMETAVCNTPTPYEKLTKQQELQLLSRALGALPEDKRELVVMHRFQGLSYEQIGDILGCEAGTVKVRMFRAVREIGKIFQALQMEKVSCCATTLDN